MSHQTASKKSSALKLLSVATAALFAGSLLGGCCTDCESCPEQAEANGCAGADGCSGKEACGGKDGCAGHGDAEGAR